MLRKLGSYPRQNGLAIALRELGRIERTLFALDWMQNVELRRRVQVGLNKGEAKNALARAVFLNRLGELRDRSYENQRYRASGLNLVVSAIILWNTVYMERAVQALREDGRDIDETLLRHLSPLGWEHINLTGDYKGCQTTILLRGIRQGPVNDMREIVNRLGLTGEAEATLHVALLRELVQGRPVTLKRLAASLNWTTDQVV